MWQLYRCPSCTRLGQASECIVSMFYVHTCVSITNGRSLGCCKKSTDMQTTTSCGAMKAANMVFTCGLLHYHVLQKVLVVCYEHDDCEQCHMADSGNTLVFSPDGDGVRVPSSLNTCKLPASVSGENNPRIYTYRHQISHTASK